MYFALLFAFISSLHAYNDLGYLRGPSVKISKWSGPYFNEEDQKNAFESLIHQNADKRRRSKMDIDPNKLFNNELHEKPKKRQTSSGPEGQIYLGEASESSSEQTLSPSERLAGLVSKPIYDENESDNEGHIEAKEEVAVAQRSEAEEEKEREGEQRKEEHQVEGGKKRAVQWHKVNFLRRRHKTRDLAAERRNKLYHEIRQYIKKSKISKHSITKRNKKERHHRTKIPKPQKKGKIMKAKTQHKRTHTSNKNSEDTARTARNSVSAAYSSEEYGTQVPDSFHADSNGFTIGPELLDKHDNSLVEDIQSNNIKAFHGSNQKTGNTRGFDDFLSDSWYQNSFSSHELEEPHGQDGIGLPFHDAVDIDANLHAPRHANYGDIHFADPTTGVVQHHGLKDNVHGYSMDSPDVGDFIEDGGVPHHPNFHNPEGLEGGDDFGPVLNHIHKTEGSHHEFTSPTVGFHNPGVARYPPVMEHSEMTAEQYGKHLDNVMAHFVPVEKLAPLGSHKAGHYFDTKETPTTGPVEMGAPIASGGAPPAKFVGKGAPAAKFAGKSAPTAKLSGKAAPKPSGGKDAKKVKPKNDESKGSSVKEGQVLKTLQDEVKRLKNELSNLKKNSGKKTERPHLAEKPSSENKSSGESTSHEAQHFVGNKDSGKKQKNVKPSEDPYASMGHSIS